MKRLLNAAVIVAALGYFVDIYDLLLFSIVRIDSLRSIGYTGRELEVGAILNNIQMTGLVLGGIFWGMLGDKKGRLSVLFGSIFLYSAANFLNSYAINFTQYGFCRFFAGLGLAGELGAGITLVAEVLPTELRGYGTMIVATVGVTGAIVGGYVAQIYPWRTSFQIGGALGLGLLVLRIGVAESGLYRQTLNSSVARGNFLSIFTNSSRFKRFMRCFLSGVPIWYTLGILITYCPEFAKNFGVSGTVTTAKAIMAAYLGFVFGDFGSGLLSQLLKSRNRAVKYAIVANFLSFLVFLFGLKGTSPEAVYFWCVVMGTTAGYWAVVVTMSAEHFGTNLRATVTTAVPNFIRFSLVPMNFVFLALKPGIGLIYAALLIGASVALIAFMAIRGLDEPFGRELDFVEAE
jgi:putative MFS transporter